MTVGEERGRANGDAEARADEALSRFLESGAGQGVARAHHVTAFIVASDGAPWLSRCVAAVQSQTRAPDEILAIDAGSSDGSGELLAASVRTITTAAPGDSSKPASGGMAAALAEGVAAAARDTTKSPAVPAAGSSHDSASDPGDPDGQDGQDRVAWYWVLHDDSAPEPGCLDELLRGADRHPAAAVLVPKTVAWSDPGRLVGVGNMWSPGKPIVETLDALERDQGQFDVDRPVYAGDSAGMLIRADVWDSLGGIDPELGNWAGPADLCRRCWGSGSEVTFIPAAILAHRRAGNRGIRREGDHPRAVTRAGQLALELSQAPRWAIPWRYLRACVVTALRGLALLLTKEPEEAASELAGAWVILGHPSRIRRTRERARRPPVTTLDRPPHTRARRGVAFTHSLDVWNSTTGGSVVRRVWPPPTWVWYPLLAASVLAVAALVRDPLQLLGSGELSGGGLLPAPGATDLMRDYLASWHDARFGTGAPMPPYLPLLAAASVPFFGSVDLLLRVVVGLTVPLAFLSCYASVGSALVMPQRILASLGYACLPAGVAASGGARLSTLALLLLGPPAARLIARALSAAHSGVGPGRARLTLAAGTMLGVVVAFAPSVYVAVVTTAIVAWLATRTPRWAVVPGLTILGVAGFFLALWLPRVLSSPWLALSEVGVNDSSLGSPGPWVWGVDPGGPTSLAWPGVPLVALAAFVVVRTSSSRRSWLLVVGAVALMAAGAWLQPVVERLWPDVGGATVWPGAWLLLAGGLLVALIAGVVGSPTTNSVPLTLLWGLAVGVLFVGWWAAPRDVEVGSTSGVPPVASLAAEASSRPRSLVLDRTSAGLGYAVAARPVPRLGDADAVAGEPVSAGFADAVTGLVSGASGAVGAELGGRGVGFVVFNGPPDDSVVPALDATVGLRQLARSPEQSLWLVTGSPSRARLGPTSAVDDGQGAAPIDVPVLTAPTSIDVVLHPQAQLPRRLTVAEAADPGWTGESSGVPLPFAANEQGMLETTVTVPGPLRVGHSSPWPALALAHLLVLAALIVLSLPKQHPVDPDASAAAGGES